MKKGSILVSILLILSSLLMVGIAVSTAVLSTTIKAERAYQSTAALDLAEAGINKAIWELNQGNTYTGEENNTSLSGGAFEVTLTNLNLVTNQIVATGYVPSKSNYKAKKTIRVRLTDKTAGTKAAFFYGVQLGTLGAQLDNNAYIDGNVYSGGSVTGKNGAYIKGSVFVYDSNGTKGTIRDIKIMDYANPNPPYIYNAWASNIFNSEIYGDATYSCGDSSCFSGNTVRGLLNPNQAPPEPLTDADWTIKDSDILAWKQLAESYGTLTSFSGTNLGAKKILGDVTVNGTLTLSGNIWITGNLTLTQNSILQLDPSYGANSGIIVVDGQINLENGSQILGSGNAKSFILMLSTKVNNSLTDPVPAIYAANGSSNAVYYAKDGVLKLNNTASAKSYAGKGLYLSQNSYFKFDQGIKNPNFTSGPGGRWDIADWQILY